MVHRMGAVPKRPVTLSGKFGHPNLEHEAGSNPASLSIVGSNPIARSNFIHLLEVREIMTLTQSPKGEPPAPEENPYYREAELAALRAQLKTGNALAQAAIRQAGVTRHPRIARLRASA